MQLVTLHGSAVQRATGLLGGHLNTSGAGRAKIMGMMEKREGGSETGKYRKKERRREGGMKGGCFLPLQSFITNHSGSNIAPIS